MEKDINHIIARVLSGEASPDDVLELSRWLNGRSENEKIFVRLKSYWTAEVSDSRAVSPDATATEKILQRIAGRKASPVFGMPRRIFIPAAAVIIALVISTLSLFYAGSRDAEAVREVYNYYTCVTDDHRSTLTLDDGTRIVLNKHSRLTYSDRYGKTDRRVKIDGEAFFEVAGNPGLPFEVNFESEVGDDAFIKVLGTVFNVSSDTVAGKIIATLVEGSICFGAQGREFTMTPDQQLEFTPGDRNIAIRTVDIEQAIAWKDGLLKYKIVTFAGLIKDLSRIYGLRIHIANERLTAPSVTVSGTFEEGQSIEQIFEVISKSLPIKWTKKGTTYYIN
ncbi:MAG: DUF4974 domain-containing protein [Tannerella sp.]|jgi:ferric-dicitrate binding protein FerR (iron transport regulator)|nr:DUF4974 domain-containing protein [Tannerella sp.]